MDILVRLLNHSLYSSNLSATKVAPWRYKQEDKSQDSSCYLATITSKNKLWKGKKSLALELNLRLETLHLNLWKNFLQLLKKGTRVASVTKYDGQTCCNLNYYCKTKGGRKELRFLCSFQPPIISTFCRNINDRCQKR